MKQMANCEKCFKFYNPVVSAECTLCRNYVFQENILCDLLRSDQGGSVEIECFAFKPDLSVVGEVKQIHEVVKDSDKEMELSDRQKWLKSYALQQWKFDSDKIFSNLNFHVCLLTKKRERVFGGVTDKLTEISSIFSNSGELFNGKVSLLCVGLDHIHLHIDSPPDYSADEVVRKIIAFSESALKNECLGLLERKEIFWKTYFIETIA